MELPLYSIGLCLLLIGVAVQRSSSTHEASCSFKGLKGNRSMYATPAKNKTITCGDKRHIVVANIVFSLNSSYLCANTSKTYYRMSDHCDDPVFLDILKKCNRKRTCNVTHVASVTPMCPGINWWTPLLTRKTTVSYGCIKSANRPTIDVCNSSAVWPQGKGSLYIVSPNFPGNSSRENITRTCCCNVTNISRIFLLQHVKETCGAPDIQFGVYNNCQFESIPFCTKTANVRVNTRSYLTYQLAWTQQGLAHSGTFLAWFKSPNGTAGSVNCSQRCLPIQSRPAASETCPKRSTAPAPACGDAADTSEQNRSAVFAAVGSALAVVVAAVVTVLLVCWCRRRRNARKRNETSTPMSDIYSQPSKRGDSSDSRAQPNDYEARPPVPDKLPDITQTGSNYSYATPHSVSPNPAATTTPSTKALGAAENAYQEYDDSRKRVYQTIDEDEEGNPEKPQQQDPAYQEYDDSKDKSYRTVDEDSTVQGKSQVSAQQDAAYQEYDDGKTDGPAYSAPYQEYDASQPPEAYSYADGYRPTNIMQRVRDDPPELTNEYELGGTQGGAAHAYASVAGK